MNFTHELFSSQILVTNFTIYSSISTTLYFFAYSINIILGFPMNSYALWLICMGTGSRIVAEFFSLNLAVCEIFFCMTCLVFAAVAKVPAVIHIAYFSVALPTAGRPLFNCVICVERYLAVLHPVSFLKCKPLRYRLVCSAVIWVMVFGFAVLCCFFLSSNNMYKFICLYLPLFLLLLSIQLFCCLYIVRALKCLEPGEKRKERQHANSIKKKAIKVILIITATMFVQYTPLIFVGFFYNTQDGGGSKDLFMSCGVAVFLMFGIVSPILYIYRVRNR